MNGGARSEDFEGGHRGNAARLIQLGGGGCGEGAVAHLDARRLSARQRKFAVAAFARIAVCARAADRRHDPYVLMHQPVHVDERHGPTA